MTWTHSHKKSKQRGCMWSESVAFVPAVVKWASCIYFYLCAVDQVGTYCSARDCVLVLKKIIQRNLGRMHRMGEEVAMDVCAFVLKSSWESFKPPASRLTRQPDSMHMPESSTTLMCKLLIRLVLSVRKSGTLEKYY